MAPMFQFSSEKTQVLSKAVRLTPFVSEVRTPSVAVICMGRVAVTCMGGSEVVICTEP